MNRIGYWILAQTQYRVHSPFVFDMYRKVLFAELDRATRSAVLAAGQEACGGAAVRRRDRCYHELVYKLRDHYGLRVVCYDGDEAVLEGDPASFGSLKVVCRPHRCRARELRWQSQQGNAKYNVSIDLYDAGILLSHPRLHPQHFLLK